jgi:hypothetical protein
MGTEHEATTTVEVEWVLRRHRPGGDEDSQPYTHRDDVERLATQANAMAAAYPGLRRPYATVVAVPARGTTPRVPCVLDDVGACDTPH